MPAQPQAHSFSGSTCGAESVPRKKRASPDVAAARNASRWLFALGDRQAVVMRPDAADQDGVAVDDQVMGGDRAGKIGLGRLDVVDAVRGGDMLHRHLQFRQALAQRIEHGFDEDGLAVENIDFRRRHLAVDAERQADLRHALQHRHGLVRNRARRHANWSWRRPDRA